MAPEHSEVLPNAAPEWHARDKELKRRIGGGLSTRGACWTASRGMKKSFNLFYFDVCFGLDKRLSTALGSEVPE
jgi:hypothetical protein